MEDEFLCISSGFVQQLTQNNDIQLSAHLEFLPECFTDVYSLYMHLIKTTKIGKNNQT